MRRDDPPWVRYRRAMKRLLLLALSTRALLACDDGTAPVRTPDATADSGDAAAPADHPALADTAPGTFEVRPGVEVVTVTGGVPGRGYTLHDATGAARLTILADADGQAHFSYLTDTHETLTSGPGSSLSGGVTGAFVAEAMPIPPGDGWVLRDDTTDPPSAVGPFRVLAVDDVPPAATYEDHPPLVGVPFGLGGHGDDPQLGLNYIRTRDGTLLSAMVRFPDPVLWGDGPWPTIIEYSGYSPANPDEPDPGTGLATYLGYASVGINMRGTGCSGGVFDIFSPAQQADAYDAIEVIARQPWVLHGHVGMVGLSYPGIAQLYAAATRPPSLAAITPMSVLSDPWELLRPGGIYNAGFTKQWLEERDRESAALGQSWTERRIAWGDPTCEAHQTLRAQNLDFEHIFKDLEFFPESGVARSVKRFAGRIEVPIYLSGGFQDEQTGPQFADILNRFDGAPARRFHLYNGRHTDGYSPLVFMRWFEFLELFVARRVPRLPDWMRSLGAAQLSDAFDSEPLTLEADRFADFGEDHAGALNAWLAEPEVRVLWESGGGGDGVQTGAPRERFALELPRWPAPDARTTRHLLTPDGRLADDDADVPEGALRFSHDLEAGTRTFFGPRGYSTTERMWDIDWTRHPDGHALAWETDALDSAMILGGPGWVEVELASTAADIHLQATLTELRPDGQEVLVQNGLLRVGHGVLDPTMTDGNALHYTWRASDYVPVVPGQRTRARVPLPSVGHVLRPGSRLRLTLASPGRNHGTWQFAEPTGEGEATHTIFVGGETGAALVLTRLDGTATGESLIIPEGYPACPGLRGQPCREAQPVRNARAP